MCSDRPAPKLSMNQMAAVNTQQTPPAQQPTLKALASLNNPELIPTPTGSNTSSPIKRPGAVTTAKPATELLSLSDVFVPLTDIKPGRDQYQSMQYLWCVNTVLSLI